MSTSRTKAMPLSFIILMVGITGCNNLNKREQQTQTVQPQAKSIAKPAAKNASNQNNPYQHSQSNDINNEESTIQTGRYSGVQAKPTHSQRKLLDVIITVTIPDDIQNIGQTVRYLLKRSGYKMVYPAPQQRELSALLLKPLPEVHRRLGPMTLKDALIILTAPAFTLTDDPVRRLISYQLDNHYKTGAIL